MSLDKRLNGVLMHISSLPGKNGIGSLGKNAFAFVDFLKEAGQSYWQILPLGPTSYGDSPYQSFSTFAGNPYFIDLEMLSEEGWLSPKDYKLDWGGSENYVDYEKVYVNRKKVFEKLCANFEKNPAADFENFCRENCGWLEDFSLFMAIKDAHDGKSFSLWEEDIRLKKTDAVAVWKEKCAGRMNYYKILQYFFYKQWNALKKYANENGIKIIGDIPIYVAADSSDVWSNPQYFYMDENCTPIEVAGCPPDAFSADGQLWGNPVYNWDAMKASGYQWWKNRLRASLKLYDIIRIDHFRGFDSYYCIPFGAKNAKIGQWRQGPGMDLFNALQDDLKNEYEKLPLIAEDLGFLTDSVRLLLKDSGFPGMKILQFGLDGGKEYLPYNCTKNSVVYTGTHDNDTCWGWFNALPKEKQKLVMKYLRVSEKEKVVEEMLLKIMECPSNTCILCIQDLIGLGSEARINIPSTVGNNWKWRASKKMLSKKISKFLKENTILYDRSGN